MTVKEVTYYEVECDYPGCRYSTGDIGHDYSAWGDRDGALTDWKCSDLQSTFEGGHYCEAHRVVQCADCDRAEGLVGDGSGEWWCPEHLETQPEYEAPSGVVV